MSKSDSFSDILFSDSTPGDCLYDMIGAEWPRQEWLKMLERNLIAIVPEREIKPIDQGTCMFCNALLNEL